MEEKFIIWVALIAIVLEAGRRYFIYRFCEEKFRKIQIIPALLLVAGMIAPFFLREWSDILLWLMAGLIDLLFYFGIWKAEDSHRQEKHWFDEQSTKKAKRQLRAFMFSYLIPLPLMVPLLICITNADNKAFEAEWQETAPLTIVNEPIKTLTNGCQIILLEVGQPEDIVERINRDNLELLKLEKGDQIKYLKAHNNKRLEITKLRGEPYKK